MIDPSIRQEFEKLSAPDLIKSFYGSESQCPHLVFANADTIQIVLPAIAIDGLTSQLQNVVFDEIHLLESITEPTLQALFADSAPMQIEN